MGGALMPDHLSAIEDWAANLLGQLELRSRNELVRTLGREIRRSQRHRIIAQRNPDGTQYAPRKKQHIRHKDGRVKRSVKMFQKLRAGKYLKVQGNGTLISIGFTGRTARIAKVHQFGLRDSTKQAGLKVGYERREILGITDADIILIRNSLISHLLKSKPKNH